MRPNISTMCVLCIRTDHSRRINTVCIIGQFLVLIFMPDIPWGRCMLSRFPKLNKLITIYIQTLATHTRKCSLLTHRQWVIIAFWSAFQFESFSLKQHNVCISQNENLNNGEFLIFPLSVDCICNSDSPCTEMKIAINVEMNNTIFGWRNIEIVGQKKQWIFNHWRFTNQVSAFIMAHDQKERRKNREKRG